MVQSPWTGGSPYAGSSYPQGYGAYPPASGYGGYAAGWPSYAGYTGYSQAAGYWQGW
jgi:hypothetical protein